jgi:hypothetical protein
MLTIEEQERDAYTAGDTTLAGALARIDDLQRALGGATAELVELQNEIAHLKRILADALADDCWRERAAAAIAD